MRSISPMVCSLISFRPLLKCHLSLVKQSRQAKQDISHAKANFLAQPQESRSSVFSFYSIYLVFQMQSTR